MLSYLALYADAWAPLRLFDYVTFRAAGAVFTALLIALVFGPYTVRKLKRFRSYARNRYEAIKDYVVYDESKEKTPSMGGILIIGSIFISTLLWARLDNPLVIAFLLVMLSLTLLGFLDDYAKVLGKPDGMPERMKLILQFAIAICAVIFLWSAASQTEQIAELMVPMMKDPLVIKNEFLDGLAREWFGFNAIVRHGIIAAVLAFGISVFAIIGGSNGVNFADGKDGLAAGCVVVSALAYLVIVYLCSHKVFANYLLIPFVPAAAEVTVFTAALIGACVGYLWWNCHPASMFMGDTGSLPLGGCIAMIAVLVRQEILLVVIGGVFVVEVLSVIIQRRCNQWFGFRPFLCTPIHHHFERKGWTETQIVVRFWIIGIICALVGLATLKIR